MRRAARIDRNHAEIVRALRASGCTVESLARVGAGVPDLLVGVPRVIPCPRTTVLIEAKDHGCALNELQVEWHARWRGGPLVTVWGVEDALRACGVRV